MSRKKREELWLPQRKVELTIQGLDFTYYPNRQTEQFCTYTSEQIEATLYDKKISFFERDSKIMKLIHECMDTVLGDGAVDRIETATGRGLTVEDWTEVMEYIVREIRHKGH